MTQRQVQRNDLLATRTRLKNQLHALSATKAAPNVAERINALIEGLLREKLTALLGADLRQQTDICQGHRNSYYTRDLITAEDPIKELRVPRDRQGQLHTQVFDRYARYEPQVEEFLRDAFVAGLSTAKVVPSPKS